MRKHKHKDFRAKFLLENLRISYVYVKNMKKRKSFFNGNSKV